MDMGSDFLRSIDEDPSAVADIESKREGFMELFFERLYDSKVEQQENLQERQKEEKMAKEEY